MTQQSKAGQVLDPMAVGRDEGEARWWFVHLHPGRWLREPDPGDE